MAHVQRILGARGFACGNPYEHHVLPLVGTNAEANLSRPRFLICPPQIAFDKQRLLPP